MSSLTLKGNDLIFNGNKIIGQVVLDTEYYYIPLQDNSWMPEHGLKLVYDFIKELNNNLPKHR